ncbi:hypothetical protein DDT52_14580 [Brenneria roseae subsp. roseae]|nr:hypothetical protein DDT52_14580 [Brenneria roseae subsp. roseae]
MVRVRFLIKSGNKKLKLENKRKRTGNYLDVILSFIWRGNFFMKVCSVFIFFRHYFNSQSQDVLAEEK